MYLGQRVKNRFLLQRNGTASVASTSIFFLNYQLAITFVVNHQFVVFCIWQSLQLSFALFESRIFVLATK